MTGYELNIGDGIMSHIGYMPYLDFEIAIFESVGIVREDEHKKQYFFEPIVLMNHKSANYQLMSFTDCERHRVAVEVTMWNEDVKRRATRFINKKLAKRASEVQVHVIPFKELTVSCDLSSLTMKHQQTTWQPYHQHKVVTFSIDCSSEGDAKNFVKQLKSNAHMFRNTFKMSFSSVKRTESKEVFIGLRDVKDTKFFKKLPQADKILLTAHDAETLVTEVTENVMAKAFKHTEVGCPESGQNVNSVLKKALAAERQQVDHNSDSEVWGSVYWGEANRNSRPDQVAALLTNINAYLEKRTKEHLNLRSYVGGQLEIRNEIVFNTKPRLVLTASLDPVARDDNDDTVHLSVADIQRTMWDDDSAKYLPKPLDVVAIYPERMVEAKEWTAQVAYSPAVSSMPINIQEKRRCDCSYWAVILTQFILLGVVAFLVAFVAVGFAWDSPHFKEWRETFQRYCRQVVAFYFPIPDDSTPVPI